MVSRIPPASGNMITAGQGPSPTGMLSAAGQIPSAASISTERCVTVTPFRRTGSRTLQAALAEILDAEGYMAEFDKLPDESYRVTLCNCAIWPVASLYGAACATELEFLQAVLPEADVERVEHKAAGGYVCGYVLGHRSTKHRDRKNTRLNSSHL